MSLKITNLNNHELLRLYKDEVIYVKDVSKFFKKYTLSEDMILKVLNISAKYYTIDVIIAIIKNISQEFFNSKKIKNELHKVLIVYHLETDLYSEIHNSIMSYNEDLIKRIVNFVFGDINSAYSWLEFISLCDIPSEIFPIVAKYIKPEDLDDWKLQFVKPSTALVEFVSYYCTNYLEKLDIYLYVMGFCSIISNNDLYNQYQAQEKIDNKLYEIFSYIDKEKRFDLVDMLFKSYKFFYSSKVDFNNDIDIDEDIQACPNNFIYLLRIFKKYIGNEQCPKLNEYYNEYLKKVENLYTTLISLKS